MGDILIHYHKSKADTLESKAALVFLIESKIFFKEIKDVLSILCNQFFVQILSGLKSFGCWNQHTNY